MIKILLLPLAVTDDVLLFSCICVRACAYVFGWRWETPGSLEKTHLSRENATNLASIHVYHPRGIEHGQCSVHTSLYKLNNSFTICIDI